MRIPKPEPSGICFGDEPVGESVPVWVGLVAEVRGRFRHATSLLPGNRPLSIKEAGKKVAQALAGPIEALGIDAAQLGDTALGDYVMAMVPVLLGLVPEKYHQGLPESEDLEDAPKEV